MGTFFDVPLDGGRIRCVLYCADPAAVRHAVLFCHGFGGHRENRAAARYAAHELAGRKDFALVTFDWPCHGSDAHETLCLEDCTRYLRRMTEYIAERFAPETLDAYATSFGGYLTLRYISEHGSPFRRIALRAPAVNMHDALTGTILPPDDCQRLLAGEVVEAGFDRKIPVTRAFVESLGQADIRQRDFTLWADRILILHGTCDEIISPAAVTAFAERNGITLIPFEGGDHRFLNPGQMDAAIERISEFLR